MWGFSFNDIQNDLNFYDMVYRAKITKCYPKVESLLNLGKYGIVRDAKDTYVEVEDETLAGLIEAMNAAEERLSKCYLDFIHYIYEH